MVLGALGCFHGYWVSTVDVLTTIAYTDAAPWWPAAPGCTHPLSPTPHPSVPFGPNMYTPLISHPPPQRSLWSQHFGSVDALMFVVDSFDKERIGEAKTELWRILKDQRLRKDAVLLVFANKQDLNNSMTPDEVQKQLELTSVTDRPWCKC